MKATGLPGTPPPVLVTALGKHDAERRNAVVAHLLGNTSADYLSDWLSRAGTPVGATTIKRYRRELNAPRVRELGGPGATVASLYKELV